MPDDLPQTAAGSLPLTQAQLGVLQGQRMSGDDSVFHAAECVEIEGDFDPARFEQALHATLREAGALHLRLVQRGDTLEQQPIAPRLPAVPALDFTDADAAAFEMELARELARPFDPARGLLYDHRLYRLGARRHCWLHRAHHLLLDGYGFQLIARRVAEHYAALVAGAAAPPAPFGELRAVVEADLAYQRSPVRDADRRFWLGRLAGLSPTSLCAAPAAGIGRGRRRSGLLPESTSALLKARAAAFGLSWPELLIAAFAGYLAVHGHGRDVVLGLPLMQRLGSPAVRTPCTAMNVMPLPLPLAAQRSLSALAADIRGCLQQLRAHQRYRFEHLEGDLEAAGYPRGLLATEINVMPFEPASHFGRCRAQTRILAAGPVEDLAAIFVARGEALGFDLDGRPQNYDTASLARHWDGIAGFLRRWLEHPEREAAGV